MNPQKFAKLGCYQIKAFTLAEVLITLAIIGVIAALTIPNLMYQHRVAQTIAALTKAQATLSNALKLAEIDNGPINTWDIGKSDSKLGAEKLGNIFFPYLKTQKICGTASGCLAPKYESLQNGYPFDTDSNNSYSKAILEDGSSIFVYSMGTGCQSGIYTNSLCGAIGIDINGIKPPNRAGIDYFEFHIWSPDGIRPTGINNDKKCEHTSTTIRNGYSCTAWVLYKKNMDYLKKDVHW